MDKGREMASKSTSNGSAVEQQHQHQHHHQTSLPSIYDAQFPFRHERFRPIAAPLSLASNDATRSASSSPPFLVQHLLSSSAIAAAAASSSSSSSQQPPHHLHQQNYQNHPPNSHLSHARDSSSSSSRQQQGSPSSMSIILPQMNAPRYEMDTSSRATSAVPVPAFDMDSRDSLRSFLDRLSCSQYFPSFLNEGFDRLQSLMDIQEDDFIAMNVRRGDRRMIQREIATLSGFPTASPLHLSTSTTSLLRLNQNDDRDSSPGREGGGGVGSYVDHGSNGLDRSISRNSDNKRPRSNNSDDSYGEPSHSGQHEGHYQHSAGHGRESGEHVAAAANSKRKYRRHPKPDPNAPEKPTSAYVQFSNVARETLKGKSFAESAKIVGEKWQNLDRHVKLGLEANATREKHRYSDLLLLYKQSDDFKEYQAYLVDFREKNSQGSGSSSLPHHHSGSTPLSRSLQGSPIPSQYSLPTPHSATNQASHMSQFDPNIKHSPIALPMSLSRLMSSNASDSISNGHSPSTTPQTSTSDSPVAASGEMARMSMKEEEERERAMEEDDDDEDQLDQDEDNEEKREDENRIMREQREHHGDYQHRGGMQQQHQDRRQLRGSTLDDRSTAAAGAASAGSAASASSTSSTTTSMGSRTNARRAEAQLQMISSAALAISDLRTSVEDDQQSNGGGASGGEKE